MLNMDHLRIFIKDILDEYFKDDTQTYSEYSDVKQFCKVSGISEFDFDDKLMKHAVFRNCVSKLDGGSKRYVHTKSGISAVNEIFGRSS